MSRTDVLKSWVRSATVAATAPLRRLPSAVTLKRLLAELQHRRVTIADAKLTAAVGHVPDVQAATVRASRGALGIEVSGRDGNDLSVRLYPHAVRFAPRGAKELVLRVDPPEAAAKPLTRDVFAALAAEMASAVWGPLLSRERRGAYSPYVHCTGDLLTLDLRDLPLVRNALARNMGAALLDFIDLVDVQAEEGRLALQLRLPAFSGR